MDDLDSQQEINKYRKFKKVDGAAYRKVNQFLRKRTYITAREWALARLCTDFRTSGGAEMTFIGRHLPELVPFMEDTYTPQAVNQARNAFKKKVRKSSATFFYGAMCGFFTTDELDDLLFEASEVARFLLEVEGTTLDIDDEIDIEDRITKVMRGVGEAAKTLLKNRGDNGAVKDLTESPDPSIVVSDRVAPPQRDPDTSPGEGTPEIPVAPATPDPAQPVYVSITTAGPTIEAEIHDGSPDPGEDLIITDTKIHENKRSLHPGKNITGENTERRSPHSGARGPEKEDS